MEGKYATSIPLGIAYLAAETLEKGFKTVVLDCRVEEYSVPELSEKILSYEPDVVGFSLTSPVANFAYETIKHIHGRGVTSSNNGIKPLIVVGGPHITDSGVDAEILGADAYIRGEVENDFSDILRDIVDLTPTSFPKSFDCGVLFNLETLKMPARQLFDESKYLFTSFSSSRGCPFNCIYCGKADSGHRKRGSESVRKELVQLKKKGVKNIDFVDDAFTVDKNHVLSVCEVLKELGFKWSASTRADLLDDELMKVMVDSGLTHLSFGLEAGDYMQRKRVGKDITDESFRFALGLCRKYGVETRVFALVGVFNETMETIKKTFDFIDELNPNDIMISPLILFPNTKAYDIALDENNISSDCWKKYILGEGELPVYIPKGFDMNEINKIIAYETDKFYLKPKKILKKIFGDIVG